MNTKAAMRRKGRKGGSNDWNLAAWTRGKIIRGGAAGVGRRGSGGDGDQKSLGLRAGGDMLREKFSRHG